MRRSTWCSLALLAACLPASYVDPGPFPFASNDTTALLSGCGERAASGHLYCRFPAGSTPVGEIVVIVPPTKCGADSCATVTVWGPDASKVLSETIPQGKTYLRIPWSRLVGAGPFQEAQRGFWPVVLTWTWIDQSGVVLKAQTEGEVRLRVHAKEYSPLTYDPSSQTWSWSTGGVRFGATDAGRTAVMPVTQ